MCSIGRVIVDSPAPGLSFVLEGAAFAAMKCWKPRVGEALTVVDSDSTGRLFRARVMKMNGDSAEVLVFEEMSGGAARGPDITLVQALLEKERMPLVIQKATELGVGRIAPCKCEKSVSLEALDSKQAKSLKWGQIALKAARQCRRPDIPVVDAARTFKEAVDLCSRAELKVVFSERKDAMDFKSVIAGKKPATVAIVSGPEGGLGAAELELAGRFGFQAASLGPRILRAETASIIGVGILRHALGG